MQGLGLAGLVYFALVLLAATAGASALSIGACLVGMKSRQTTVRRGVASVVAGLVSAPVAVAGAFGCYYLASFRGIGFAADYGVYFAVGGAAVAGLVVGFTTGRLLSPSHEGAGGELPPSRFGKRIIIWAVAFAVLAAGLGWFTGTRLSQAASFQMTYHDWASGKCPEDFVKPVYRVLANPVVSGLGGAAVGALAGYLTGRRRFE